MIAKKGKYKANPGGWGELVSYVIRNNGYARMKRVAVACNEAADTDDYKVSVEGEYPLRKRAFRVTVITAGAVAIRDNAKNQTLIRNFWRASGPA